MTRAFYDELAPYYHLIFEDWQAGIERQGAWLDSLLRTEWPGTRTVLDAAAGIGTQSLGLAARGYRVTASDLSPVAVARAAHEATARGSSLETATADLRTLSSVHGEHDVVVACDNALPHLLTDDEISQGLRECFACIRPGGGFVMTMRDYARPGTGTEVRPQGVRKVGDSRYLLFQVWDWDGAHYGLAQYVVHETPSAPPETRAFRSRYYAVSVDRVAELMKRAGFEKVRRLDESTYQPVLIGTKRGPSTGTTGTMRAVR